LQPAQTYTDRIAQKRADAEQKQREQKTQAALEGIATSGNIDELIKQVKEVQLASLLNNNKPQVILTDQTDLGDKISEAIKSLETSNIDGQQLSALKDLAKALESSRRAQSDDASALKKALAAVEVAVKALNMSPVVNVPEPKVTIREAKIDLAPLQKTIIEALTPVETVVAAPAAEERLDLDCYKAQDINNDTPDMQYVGFVNPEGNWYIIENDVNGNKLRYVFGGSGYADAFAKASTYEYGLLNEAVDALTA
jgi:hypothetical protein